MEHVLIADDHAVTRRGVRELVSERYTQAVFTELADGDEVLRHLPTRRWDLILLDILMPGPRITELLARIRERAPSVPVLVLTSSNEVAYVVETLKAGANGLVHKHQASDELLQAIERVCSGGTYLHADAAAAIASSLCRQQQLLPHEDLSERELDIFQRIALGRSIKEIGFDLGLSEKTVATYLARIREKTGLTSHVDIARYALKNGLVD